MSLPANIKDANIALACPWSNLDDASQDHSNFIKGVMLKRGLEDGRHLFAIRWSCVVSERWIIITCFGDWVFETKI